MGRGNRVTGVRWHRETVRARRGVKLIMVGRPRKRGRREPNGRVARTYTNPRAQVADQPHRRGVIAEMREREEAGSEFGRMMLRGAITPAQYEAGRLYALLVDQFRIVKGYPPFHPRGIDLLGPGGRSVREPSQEIVQAVTDRYNAAFEACSEAGNRAQRAVKDHAVLDRRVADFETRDLLKSGLDKLIAHFRLDENMEISNRQK